MKVCTDACILGAWTAKYLATAKTKIAKILDVGAGTGLLSLMLAQKTDAIIDAIEIDKMAFEQASDNFRQSLWSKRLTAFEVDARDFYPCNKYDFIVTNPPFYEDDLLSPSANKNVAKHGEQLKLDELILVIKNNLKASGSFAILLPYHRIAYFEDIAQKNNFFLREKLLIKQTLQHNYFRGILLFSREKSSPNVQDLTIMEDGNYSFTFIELMKDYYLKL